jgi:hypothetical protein
VGVPVIDRSHQREKVPPRRVSSLILIVVLLLGEATFAPGTAGVQQLPTTPGDAAVAGLVRDTQPDERADLQDLAYPAAPMGAYRPRFVRQTGKNCAFASAAMLIDKWTAGASRPAQAKLRTASRVPGSQGVSFGELSRAVARVSGIDLRYSPNGGDPLTWNELMSRLARGGAAVVGGAYSRLPRHYQRWGRSFAALGAARSGHAVYVERYQATRRGGRVWMMDPLASSSKYSGEWISTRALRRYAWRNSKDLVTAAATPEPPVFAGYEIGPPEVDPARSLAGQQVTVRLPLTIEPGWSKPDHLVLSAAWHLETPDPDPSAPSAVEGSASGQGDDLTPNAGLRRLAVAADSEQEPTNESADEDAGRQLVRLRVKHGALVGSLDAPEQPGIYRLEVELRRKDGSRFADGVLPTFDDLTLHLRGPLAAKFGELSTGEPTSKGSAEIQLTVFNRGSLDWTDENRVQLVAGWLTATGVETAATVDIELASGAETTLSFVAATGTDVGAGRLQLELVTADGVAFSDHGLAPMIVLIRFVDPSSELN